MIRKEVLTQITGSGALITGGVAFSYGIDLAFYFVPGSVRHVSTSSFLSAAAKTIRSSRS